jgi:small-conductance mechanosensitive channel
MGLSAGSRTWAVARRAAPLLLAAALFPASPAGAAGPAGSPEAGWVELRGERIVRLETARAGRTAAQRAEEANRALAAAVQVEAATARVVPDADTARIQLGEVPVLVLDADDARSAGAASLEAHAAAVVARLDAAVRSERRRATAAGAVFSVSLLVFAGLLAWLLLRRLPALELQLGRRLRLGPGSPPLRVAGVDVGHAAASPGVRTAVLRVARLLTQALVIWIWALFALSLFPRSRPGAEWLLRAVLVPVADLASRLGRALPALVAVGVIVLLALAATRVLRLVFDRVARGEASLPLVDRDRARALGRLTRGAVVLVALLLAAPLVAGGDGNALGRLGEAALLALALAAVPLAAAVLAGLPWLLGRSLKVGDRAEVGGRTGRVAAFGALTLELEEPGGARVAVPWLLTLFHPVRLLPPGPGEGAPGP